MAQERILAGEIINKIDMYGGKIKKITLKWMSQEDNQHSGLEHITSHLPVT